jgi:hypothetical protein
VLVQPELTAEQVSRLERLSEEADIELDALLARFEPLHRLPYDQMLESRTAAAVLESVGRECERLIQPVISDISTYAWLKILRTLPDSVFTWPGKGPHFAAQARDIAGAIVGTTCPTGREVTNDAEEYLTSVEAAAGVRLASVGRRLKSVHSFLRMAEKEVAFERTAPAYLEPRPSASQSSALSTYDSRVLTGSQSPLLAHPGLSLATLGKPLTEPPGPHDIMLIGRSPQPYEVEASAWGLDSAVLRYQLTGADLGPLRSFNVIALKEGSPWYSRKVISVAVLLRVCYQLIYDNPLYLLSTENRGYLSFNREGPASLQAYIDRLLPTLAQFCDSVFPHVAPPQDAAQLLADLSELEPSVWPLRSGPLVHEGRLSRTVDLHAASRKLEESLLMPVSDDEFGNQRGHAFELAAQALVDQTPWGSLPQDLRSLRGKALKDASGRQRTDLDAIGLKDDVLLLIDCLSKVRPADSIYSGKHAFYRNEAQRVEDKVSGPLGEPGKAWAAKCAAVAVHPVLARYKKVLPVVLTPVPIYVEPALVGRPKIHATEELTPGLLKAASWDELDAWLQGQ